MNKPEDNTHELSQRLIYWAKCAKITGTILRDIPDFSRTDSAILEGVNLGLQVAAKKVYDFEQRIKFERENPPTSEKP